MRSPTRPLLINDVPDGVFLLPVDRANTDGRPRSLSICSDSPLKGAKLAWAEGQRFDCATWLHNARALSKEEFRREVEKKLTGRETEPDEISYFKVCSRARPRSSNRHWKQQL